MGISAQSVGRTSKIVAITACAGGVLAIGFNSQSRMDSRGCGPTSLSCGEGVVVQARYSIEEPSVRDPLVLEVDEFIVSEGEIIEFDRDVEIRATGTVRIDGTIIMADGVPGERGCGLTISTPESVEINGYVYIGNGGSGVFPGQAGGGGGDFLIDSPLVISTVPLLAAGDGGDGGPAGHGGAGGAAIVSGVLVTHLHEAESVTELRGGAGGSGGEGVSYLTEEFVNGGNGGDGGMAMIGDSAVHGETGGDGDDYDGSPGANGADGGECQDGINGGAGGNATGGVGGSGGNGANYVIGGTNPPGNGGNGGRGGDGDAGNGGRGGKGGDCCPPRSSFGRWWSGGRWRRWWQWHRR